HQGESHKPSRKGGPRSAPGTRAAAEPGPQRSEGHGPDRIPRCCSCPCWPRNTPTTLASTSRRSIRTFRAAHGRPAALWGRNEERGECQVRVERPAECPHGRAVGTG